MSTVNRNLLLSLTQDLKNLNSTQEKILSNLKSFELISWLYPTKQFRQVDFTLIDTAPESLRYTMTLEFIIDKMYLIINLMVNYISSVTKEKLQKNINCAKLTLGASVEMLWNKIESIKKLNISKAESALMHLESFTQTVEDTKLQPEPTTPFFKEITAVLLSDKDLRSLKQAKEKLQQDVYGLTEYSCVNKLTSALVEDFKRLVERRNHLENQNIKIRSKLKRFLLKYKKSIKNVENVRYSLRKINRMYCNVRKRNKILRVKLNFEDNQRNRIQEYQEKLKHLEQSFEDSCIKVNSLNLEKNTLRDDLNERLLESDQLKEEILLWKNRFSEVYLENSNLLSSAKLVKESNIFKNSLKNVYNYCCMFLEKLESVNVTIDQRSKSFKDFVKMIADVADSQVIKEDDGLRQQLSSFIGDPISDMRQQIKSNNDVIEDLKKSNLKLLETIKKIQSRTTTVMVPYVP
ncbi:hypothetical protein FQR65_LT03962 [Abscondita terminalis]|nr:hypothetical protein FQR65_LT03962 [Abscondita terminalis]